MVARSGVANNQAAVPSLIRPLTPPHSPRISRALGQHSGDTRSTLGTPRAYCLSGQVSLDDRKAALFGAGSRWQLSLYFYQCPYTNDASNTEQSVIDAHPHREWERWWVWQSSRRTEKETRGKRHKTHCSCYSNTLQATILKPRQNEKLAEFDVVIYLQRLFISTTSN